MDATISRSTEDIIKMLKHLEPSASNEIQCYIYVYDYLCNNKYYNVNFCVWQNDPEFKNVSL